MPFANRKKNILEDLFSPELPRFKKYHPSENLKFNNLGIFRGLKLRILMEKNPFQFRIATIKKYITPLET